MFDERDRAILDFEREWWQHPGAKEDAIRQTFGLSPARYYQVLGKLMDSEAALAYDPMLVKRLHRVREDRQSSRQKRVNPDSPEKN
ncbi:MAG: DUF3263 domain-containing protein [Rhodoluna sp.]|uniref:DUF3263 domain-containing protein n=1 Tax=Aurantimicrobium minutum TaxID=708131 RepID=UPI0024738B7B|nr:DUF3263 domain-containing protein [Aurantimicrobium minutum]MDH6277145.1 hypothetical protein [Aurantimicrobium minutum]